MVPYGSHRALQAAPVCTESGDPDEVDDPMQNAASPKFVGTCGVDLHQDASPCIKVPEEGVEPSCPRGHWILSAAGRLNGFRVGGRKPLETPGVRVFCLNRVRSRHGTFSEPNSGKTAGMFPLKSPVGVPVPASTLHGRGRVLGLGENG
jgi:hypothetical protein